MCYKPDMRKWMSERLKRRKKEPEKAGTDPAQAPLQPAFYDTEPPQPEPANPEQAAAAPLQPESAHAVAAGRATAGSTTASRKRRCQPNAGDGAVEGVAAAAAMALRR